MACGNPLNNLERILGAWDEPLEIHECFKAWLVTHPNSDLQSIFDMVSSELWNLDLLVNDPALCDWDAVWMELRSRAEDDPKRRWHMQELVRRAVLSHVPGRKYLFSFCYKDYQGRNGSWTKAEGWTHCINCRKCQSGGTWHCKKCHVCREDMGKPCIKCGGVSSTYQPLAGVVRPYVSAS